MNKERVYLIFGLVASILIVGCAKQMEELAEPPQPVPKTIEDETPEDNKKQEIIVSQAKTEDDGMPPALKNLGFDINPWDKTTNLAGDLIFTKKLIFDDGHVSNDKVFIDFGHADKYRIGSAGIEYWFFVPLGTKAHAPVDGAVSISFFEHTQDWGVNIVPKGSQWIVSFEHLVNLKVKEGDIVKAGDVVGEASPRNTFSYGIAMAELAVWTGGNVIIKYCPFEFLDESLKPIYDEKINRLANEWEEFIGKDVYKQEDWVAPGCLLHNITERS